MADAHFLAIDILNMVAKYSEPLNLELAGGKRARATSTERSKALKLAAARIEAEEFVKRELTDPTAIAIMNRAKVLLNEGPDTTSVLCNSLGSVDITNIERFIDDEEERNGPTFYMKLLPHFVPEYRQFKQVYEHQSIAKSAMEKSWNFRMMTLFMNADCSMTRDGIAAALDERRTFLKRSAEEHERNVQVNAQVNAAAQQQLRDVLGNPQALAELVADPRVIQAILAARAASGEVVD